MTSKGPGPFQCSNCERDVSEKHGWGDMRKSEQTKAKTLRRKPSETVGWLKRNWLNQKKNAKSVEFFFWYISSKKINFGPKKAESGCKFHTYTIVFRCCELNSSIAIFWYFLLSLRATRNIVDLSVRIQSCPKDNYCSKRQLGVPTAVVCIQLLRKVSNHLDCS